MLPRLTLVRVWRRRRPLGHFSKKLSVSEAGRTIEHREALVIGEGVVRLVHYALGWQLWFSRIKIRSFFFCKKILQAD